jgi:hypothetical protein
MTDSPAPTATAQSADRPAFAFTEYEMQKIVTQPGALRAMADWHDNQATMADAMGCHGSSKFHTERAQVLTAEADRIQKEWEDG